MILQPPPLIILAVLRSLLILGAALASESECSGSRVDHSYYNYQDHVVASSRSPLPLSQTPQFISLTSDDNGYSGLNGVAGGTDWFLKLLATKVHPSDGSPVLATFYHTSKFVTKATMDNPVLVKRAWREAMEAGHEVALHAHDHVSGMHYSEAEWLNQINQCVDWLTKPWDPTEETSSPDPNKGIGAKIEDIVGWRSPLLEYNGFLFDALKSAGIWYDTSIEDGWQDNHDGTNYYWPYTLNDASPVFDVFNRWGRPPLGTYPGLWELPKHPFVVPPDDMAAKYGIPMGLRDKCKTKASWFDTNTGKITGSDYNLLVKFGMTAPEFLATLKYSFDLRYDNNRSPMSLGLHADKFSDKYNPAGVQTTPEERRQALSDFLDYVLSKPDTRVATSRDVLGWMRDPVPKWCLEDGGAHAGPEPVTTTTTTTTKKKKTIRITITKMTTTTTPAA